MGFEIGTIAGSYEVLEHIGQGGMGQVYRVRHVISDRIEAMKVLLPDLEAASGLEERFLREIKVQASLTHPNIVSLHTAFRHENRLLMVMEFVEGESLRTAMTTRGLTIEESLRHVKDVLRALDYAHSKGVVHRDIKPGNIMIGAQGQVKLLDFGLATLEREVQLTRSGAVLGSLQYMSPEQVQSKPADARSDIYSVGVMLYQMVTGTPPIQGESDYAIMHGHLTQVPANPASINPQVPGHIAAAILRALEKDPEKRFQRPKEFIAALEGEETRAITTIAVPPPAPAPTPQLDTERASKVLAKYIGPIARVVVKRETKSASDWRTLRERLAAEIPSDTDRQKFLREMQ